MSSEHFSDKELACRHCGVNRCTPELVQALEAFRARAGKPVRVNDAYRCPDHNRQVGGAKASQHLLGLAADISVEGMTAAELEAVARRIPEIRGIGRGDHQHYLHIDVREKPTCWCYDQHGKETAYFPPHPTSHEG